jgi:hypothetical protein
MDALFWRPLPIQDFPPPPGSARKKVAFKILDTLFPADTVAALPAIEEHLPIAEHLVQGTEGGAPFLLLFLPLGLAALVPGLPAFLTAHKKVFSLRTVVL